MTEFVVLQDPESASRWLPSLVKLFVDAIHYGPQFDYKRRPTLEDAEEYWSRAFRDLGQNRQIWLAVEVSTIHAAVQVFYLTNLSPRSLHVVDLFVPTSGDHRGHGCRLYSAIQPPPELRVVTNLQTNFTLLHLG